MYLVNEYDNVRVLLQLMQESLDALFKLTTIFSASNYSGHIKPKNALVEQQRRSATASNKLRKSFSNSTLAYAWFADKNRVVFLSATQNFSDTLYLLVASDDKVKFTLCCCKGKVGGELVKYGCLVCSATHRFACSIRSGIFTLPVITRSKIVLRH